MKRHLVAWIDRHGWRRVIAGLVGATLVVLVALGWACMALVEHGLLGERQAEALFLAAALLVLGGKMALLAAAVDDLLAERRQLQFEVDRQGAAGRQLQAISLRDEVTGLGNRRYFFEAGAELAGRAQRQDRWLAALVLDIDHFKQINDAQGHIEGDQALRRFGRRLKDAVRGGDIVARYGGDEFVALLPDTDEAGALIAAERLLAAMREPGEPMPMTVSIGAAAARGGEAELDRLIAGADAALLEAKRRGRDRVLGASTLLGTA